MTYFVQNVLIIMRDVCSHTYKYVSGYIPFNLLRLVATGQRLGQCISVFEPYYSYFKTYGGKFTVESKNKKFARKVVAFFLAVIMAVSTFSAAFTAFAASDRDYYDDNLAHNILNWADATDEQAAEALLDYVDSILSKADIYLNVEQNIVVANIKIKSHVDSVDAALELVSRQVSPLLGKLGGVAGDVKMLNLSAITNLKFSDKAGDVTSDCGISYRAVNSAKNIIKALAQVIYDNANAKNNVIGKLLLGEFTLGAIAEGAIGGNVYDLLAPMLGVDKGFQSDLVYNIASSMLWTKTGWFTPDQVAGFKANPQTWNIDEQVLKVVSEKYLPQISAYVTYPLYDGTAHTESSGDRLKKIEAKMEADKCDYKTAASALGYDPNLVYCTWPGLSNNICIFQYGDEKLTIDKNTTLYSFAAQAFKLAWKTVLKDTLGLVHVNFDNWEGRPTNFDNEYFYYMSKNNKWNSNDWKSNYSKENVEAWAKATYQDYAKQYPNANIKSAEDLLACVRKDAEMSRTVVENPKYNWRDIDTTQLFNKMRYSPLADLYLGVQTGPLNLYLLQTGFSNTATYLDEYAKRPASSAGIVGVLNNALVAMCKDLFVESEHIGVTTAEGTFKHIARPTLETTEEFTTFNDANRKALVEAIFNNFAKIFEYMLNVTDQNILAAFYQKNSITFDGANFNLTEKNLEEAMLPLLIACLNEINLIDQIHNEAWDKCTSAEAVAITVLEEHLAYVLPDKDYSVLYKFDEKGNMVPANDLTPDNQKEANLLDDVILMMTRDAVGYQLAPILPLRDKNLKEWSPYKSDPATDKTTLYELLNNVVVYYCSSNTWADDNTQSQGMADLLGVVAKDGKSLVNINNDLFTNIDNIVNHLFPWIGALQYGTYDKQGQASSKDLLINTIVDGCFEIGEIKDQANNYGGIKNFLNQLITLFTSAPIVEKDVLHVVYDDVLAGLLNAIFGARYDTQYPQLVPYSKEFGASASTPFDTLLKRDWIVRYKNDGCVAILVDAIYKAFGCNGDVMAPNKEGVDGAWQAFGFILQAVSSFVPSFVPQLQPHEFRALSAEVANSTQTGLTAGGDFVKTDLELTNNSFGLNNFYKDESGQVVHDGRFFMQITDVKAYDSNGNVASNITLGSAKDVVVAPQDTAKISVSGKVENGKETAVYKIIATYDVYEGTNANKTQKKLHSNQTTQAYLVLSTVKDWVHEVYNSKLDGFINTPNAGQTAGNSISTNLGASNGKCFATFAKKTIVSMSNPSQVNTYKFRFHNNDNPWFGDGVGEFAGMYCYVPNGFEAYPIEQNGQVSNTVHKFAGDEGRTYGFVAVNESTGDILRHGWFDYFNPIDGKWYRGGNDGVTQHANGAFHGYTAKEIETVKTKPVTYNDKPTTLGEVPGFQTRTHIVWTLEEYLGDVDKGTVTHVNREVIGVDSEGKNVYRYKNVIIKATDALIFGDNGSVSMATPINGIYITKGHTTIGKNGTQFTPWLAYDGVTKLNPVTTDIHIMLGKEGSKGCSADLQLQVVDDRQSAAIKKQYANVSSQYDPYNAGDFENVDYNGTTMNPFDGVQKALADALQESAKVLTYSNADSYVSNLIDVANVSDTTAIAGDPAFKPLTENDGISPSLAVECTKKNGYWYYDEEGTIPVYSNKHITDSDVKDIADKTFGTTTYKTGKDAAGTEVVKIGDDWYVLNAPKMQTAWDTTTYDAPYKYKTTTQVGSQEGKTPVYEKVQYKYYTNKGVTTNPSDVWINKVANKHSIIKPNTAPIDNRNNTEMVIDTLNYWNEIAMSNVKVGGAAKIIEQVQKDRLAKGSEAINYDIYSFTKMNEAARQAESLVTTTWVNSDRPMLDANGKPMTDPETGEQLWEKDPVYSTKASAIQVQQAINDYKKWEGRLVDRGFISNQLDKAVAWSTNDAKLTDLDFTKVDGTDAKPATYTEVKAPTAHYGTVENGVIVNKNADGSQAYTDASWNAYINALGRAIDVAKNHATTGEKTSDAYVVRNNLMISENELDPFVPVDPEPSENITVSGTTLVATDITGTAHNKGIVGIEVVTDFTLDEKGHIVGGTVVATSAEDGTFTAKIPAGTKQLGFRGTTTVDRVVTLAGDKDVANVEIPIVICDYNRDSYINGMDTGKYAKALSDYDVNMDLNGDGFVNGMDTGVYAKFIGNTINYDPITLA